MIMKLINNVTILEIEFEKESHGAYVAQFCDDLMQHHEAGSLSYPKLEELALNAIYLLMMALSSDMITKRVANSERQSILLLERSVFDDMADYREDEY